MAEIYIRGIEETAAALEAMPDRIAKVATVKALNAAVKPIMEEMSPRIPVGATGKLRAALMYIINVAADGRNAVASIGFGKMGYLARWIEFGTHHLGHKPKKVDTGVLLPARPFMRPAAETAAAAAIEAFAASVKESLDEGLS